MTKSELFARVKATFIRLASRKKPMVGAAPDRTVERMIMSFSCPWNPSTVLNLYRSVEHLHPMGFSLLNLLQNVLSVDSGEMSSKLADLLLVH
jgi:hypothetical protein